MSLLGKLKAKGSNTIDQFQMMANVGEILNAIMVKDKEKLVNKLMELIDDEKIQAAKQGITAAFLKWQAAAGEGISKSIVVKPTITGDDIQFSTWENKEGKATPVFMADISQFDKNNFHAILNVLADAIFKENAE